MIPQPILIFFSVPVVWFGCIQLPQYDNFYIDLNFLIHNAVPNHECGTDDEHENVDADVFDRILTAIETLYRLIRPTKLFFLSIDGVAPRAKWNKQRQRR